MTLYKKSSDIKLIKSTRKKIGAIFNKFGLSPNIWSIGVLLSAIIAAFFILNKQFLLGAIFVLLSGFFDIVDGAVARAMKKETKFGAYLDTIIDRYSEFIFILPFTMLELLTFIMPFSFWLFLYLFGGLMTTYAKAAAKEKEIVKGKWELKGGILERAERVVLLAVAIFAGAFNILYFVYPIIALAILSNISALQRISIAFKECPS